MKTNTPCPHPSIVQLEQGDKITTQCTKCGKKMGVERKNTPCYCYGGFDCEVCNPDYYEKKPDHTEQHLEMVSDTPRTIVSQKIRSFSEKELIEFCQTWATEHLKDHHGKETYYARLGLLVDFATDIFNDK
jgi:hypothetical protein